MKVEDDQKQMDTDRQHAEVFDALGHPTRILILKVLNDGAVGFADLKKKTAITPKGEWIIGSRYYDTKLGRHPTRYDLDKVSTEHPIMIRHSSGHVGVVNSYALAMAKIDKNS